MLLPALTPKRKFDVPAEAVIISAPSAKVTSELKEPEVAVIPALKEYYGINFNINDIKPSLSVYCAPGELSNC